MTVYLASPANDLESPRKATEIEINNIPTVPEEKVLMNKTRSMSEKRRKVSVGWNYQLKLSADQQIAGASNITRLITNSSFDWKSTRISFPQNKEKKTFLFSLINSQPTIFQRRHLVPIVDHGIKVRICKSESVETLDRVEQCQLHSLAVKSIESRLNARL